MPSVIPSRSSLSPIRALPTATFHASVSLRRLFYDLLIDPQVIHGLPSDTPMGRLGLTSGTHLQRSTALAVACLVVASFAYAIPRGERHEVRHEIDQLEDHWRDAVLNRNVAAMDSLLAGDYMAITANGALESKDETLARMRAGSVHIKSIDVTDRKVRFYGSTALVTCRAEVTGTTPEGELKGSYRYTRVYVRDPNGKWRIVSFEASRIREPDDHK
jgi:ketosteroid isomerase-like protein